VRHGCDEEKSRSRHASGTGGIPVLLALQPAAIQ
jgi:hypothetical protein